jgi:hypothetical protein
VAALTVTAATAAGATPAAAVQITAWSGTGDTIAASDIGARGVVCIVTNSSGGSLDFRVNDSGSTPAGNAAANAYTTVTVPNGATRWVFVGVNNLDPTGASVKVGASTTNAGFVVTCMRY